MLLPPLMAVYSRQHLAYSHLQSGIRISWQQVSGPYKKSKAVAATGRGDPQVFETSRIPHFLDIRPRDGGEVVIIARW
jgi:hypothetical protein